MATVNVSEKRWRRVKDAIARVYRSFPDGAEIGQDSGGFDDFCVYVKKAGSSKYVTPLDVDYFTASLILAKIFSKEKVYGDFCTVFNATTNAIEPEVFQKIHDISLTYGIYQQRAETVFIIYYLTMYAEERKAGAVLKKYIKRLGLHALFFKEFTVDEAADFMKNVDWRILAKMCELCGFLPRLSPFRAGQYAQFCKELASGTGWDELVNMCVKSQAEKRAKNEKQYAPKQYRASA